MNKPDKWLLVKVKNKELYKVFATWSGGYLNGDSWRINSGITVITEDEDHLYFYGESGSCYMCNKNSYGVNPYGGSILAQLENHVDVLAKEEAKGWVAMKLLAKLDDELDLER